MRMKESVILFLPYLLLLFSCRKETTVPDITTLTVQNLKHYTANCGGLINNDGGSEVFLRGVCWAIHPNPTISDDTTINMGDRHHFISLLQDLTPATTYYVRAYAVNAAGIGYGQTIAFTTLKGTIPVLQTHHVSEVYSMQANVEGEVIANGDLSVTERGICWGTEPFPTINDGKMAAPGSTSRFTVTIRQLQPTTVYYARAYAINQAGVGYGEHLEFTTPEAEPFPLVLTAPIEKITQWSAVGTGEIHNEGRLPISERGICWGTAPNPQRISNYKSDTTGSDFISVKMDYLKPLVTYYVRAYVVSIAGIVYGNQQIFTTHAIGAACPGSPSVTDIDGNVYQTVQAGDICIFKENLKTTKFSDGDPILYSDANTTQAAYTWYDKNQQNISRYGGLYNWDAVASDKGLCPEGWHVPTNQEWNSMNAYFGFVSSFLDVPPDISVIKSTRTEPDPHPRWSAGGVPSNDLSGLSALPGGIRHSSLGFRWIGGSAYFWSSSELVPSSSWARAIYNNYATLHTYGSMKGSHLSVRCVKD